MGDSIAGIQHDTGGLATSVEGEDSLDGYKQSWHAVFVEEDVDELQLVGQGVHIRLGEQHWVLLRGGLEQGVGVLPEQLHVVPVLDNAVVYRILHFEQAAPLAVECLAHHYLLLGGGRDHHFVLGSSHSDITSIVH